MKVSGLTVPGGHALQAVVAHCGCGLQAFVNISGVEEVALLRGVSPDAGEAVGLQFKADGKLVGGLRVLLLGRAHFALDAQQFLHVMSDFVGQDVGFGEFSGRAEALLQFVVEAQIDVNLLVLGAVERAGGGLGHAAGGIDGVAKQDQLGVAVGHALRRKNLAPGVLGVVQDESDEVDQRLFLLIARGIGLADSGAGRAHGAVADQRQKVALENQAQDEQDNHAAQAEVNAAELKAAATPPLSSRRSSTSSLLPPGVQRMFDS